MQEKKLFLREAEPSDLDLLFEWANNEFVRQNAFHTKPITYEEHKKWFEKLLNDREQIQFIMYLGDEPVGQARLTVNMEEAEIDYSIAAEKRGMGYGKELIRLVQDIVYNEYASIKKLTAKVKASNAASIYCFRKNGFSEVYHQYEYEMAEHRPEKNIEPEISGGGQETFLYLTNNKNTLDLFEWISKRCSAVILSDRLDIDVLKRLRPKLVISYNYIYMISKECIEYMDGV